MGVGTSVASPAQPARTKLKAKSKVMTRPKKAVRDPTGKITPVVRLAV